MKHSIRKRLFFQILLTLLFVFIFIMIINIAFLKGIYIKDKKNELVDAGSEISQMQTSNYSEHINRLSQIEENLNAQIQISSNNEVLYSSFDRSIKGMPMRPNPNNNINDFMRSRPMMGMMSRNPANHIETLNEKTQILTIRNAGLNNSYMVLNQLLSDNSTLNIIIPLEPFDEAVRLFNSFLFIVALLSILVALIWSYFASKRFTQPILSMNQTAKAMANLDFGMKCKTGTKDELEELGQNINDMSDKLESTITNLNDKNLQLLNEVEKVNKLNVLSKQFVSDVSHELKTPVSIIKGYTEGLAVGLHDDEEKRQYYCDVIIDEAQKMDNLVNDLLDLSRLESGYFKLNRTEFYLKNWLTMLFDKYKKITDEKGITLSIETDTNAKVNGDMQKLEQVFSNYLNNAIHYGDGGKITISAKIENEAVRVTVYNSGTAINEEDIENIWVSFYKADEARTRDDKTGGYGLGLAIVRNIQEMHNQEYGAFNANDGVSFYFDIETA